MRLVRLALFSALLAGCATVNAFDNVIGLEWGSVNASGSICDGFPATSGCVDDEQNGRFYYGARFTDTLELRATFTFMDVRLTDEIDPVFNDPSVNSEMLDIAAMFHWPLNDWARLSGKLGLGFWDETRAGGSFLFGETENGVAPVVGVATEIGNQAVAFTASADLYPSVGDTDHVSFVGVGVRVKF